MRSLWLSLAVAAASSLTGEAVLKAEPPTKPAPAGSTLRIQNNGSGATVIVDNNSPGSSSTVIINGQKVVGNEVPGPVGKDKDLWSMNFSSGGVGMTLYYSPKNGQWYRWVAEEKRFRPVPEAWLRLFDWDD